MEPNQQPSDDTFGLTSINDNGRDVKIVKKESNKVADVIQEEKEQEIQKPEPKKEEPQKQQQFKQQRNKENVQVPKKEKEFVIKNTNLYGNQRNQSEIRFKKPKTAEIKSNQKEYITSIFKQKNAFNIEMKPKKKSTSIVRLIESKNNQIDLEKFKKNFEDVISNNFKKFYNDLQEDELRNAITQLESKHFMQKELTTQQNLQISNQKQLNKIKYAVEEKMKKRNMLLKQLDGFQLPPSKVYNEEKENELRAKQKKLEDNIIMAAQQQKELDEMRNQRNMVVVQVKKRCQQIKEKAQRIAQEIQIDKNAIARNKKNQKQFYLDLDKETNGKIPDLTKKIQKSYQQKSKQLLQKHPLNSQIEEQLQYYKDDLVISQFYKNELELEKDFCKRRDDERRQNLQELRAEKEKYQEELRAEYDRISAKIQQQLDKFTLDLKDPQFREYEQIEKLLVNYNKEQETNDNLREQITRSSEDETAIKKIVMAKRQQKMELKQNLHKQQQKILVSNVEDEELKLSNDANQQPNEEELQKNPELTEEEQRQVNEFEEKEREQIKINQLHKDKSQNLETLKKAYYEIATLVSRILFQLVSQGNTSSIAQQQQSIYAQEEMIKNPFKVKQYLLNQLSDASLRLEQMLTILYKKRRNFNIESINTDGTVKQPPTYLGLNLKVNVTNKDEKVKIQRQDSDEFSNASIPKNDSFNQSFNFDEVRLQAKLKQEMSTKKK